MKLSVIVPVRNERDTIHEVLSAVRGVAIGMPKEIIVVDGASTDGTREFLLDSPQEDLVLVLEDVARGKGAAVCRGLERATGDLFIVQDGDMELVPAEYPQLIQPLLDGQADAILGSRFLNGRGQTSRFSYVGNQIITTFCNLLFRGHLTDVLTAYKVMPVALVRSLDLRCNGFNLDGELTAKLLRRRLSLLEVPITYNPRSRGEGKKLRWHDGLSVIFAIVRVRVTADSDV